MIVDLQRRQTWSILKNSLEFKFRNSVKMTDKTDMIREALKYLNLDEVPSMKELNTLYRKLALIKHPDKNGGSDAAKEDYQVLQKFYKLIGNHIIENETDVSDEEGDHIKAFKNFNHDQKNKFCHTIMIEKKLSAAWKQVLTSKIGEPENKGKNGLIYKVSEFSFNNELFTITVTLYEAPKDGKPKIHIQSPSQLANDEFTLKELPLFYEEVRKVVPQEMIEAVNDVSDDASDGPKKRGRPPTRLTAKMIRTVKDPVKYCQIKFCEFTTKLDKDLTAHKQTHRREKSLNLQRDMTEDGSESEMEIVITEDEVNTPKVSPGDQPFNFVKSYHAQTKTVLEHKEEIEKLKCDLVEKNKIVEELEAKIAEFEKVTDNLEKRLKKEESLKEKALGDMKLELTKAMDKASALCEENTLFREKIKTFQNKEIADSRIQQKYEELINVEKATTGCQTEADDEDDNIEALILHKKAGFRRTDPTAPSVAVAAPQRVDMVKEIHKCSLCEFNSNDENSLKTHVSMKHHQCDICERILKTPVLLRSHLQEIHEMKNGTMISCKECDFSALNEQHLKVHTERHHKEIFCNQCHFHTRSIEKLKRHKTERHRRERNETCKYWMENRCNRDNCQYQHRRLSCRYGQKCNVRNCQFEHPFVPSPTQPQTSPWINPAFLKGAESVKSFPFLGETCQCRRQNKSRGM